MTLIIVCAVFFSLLYYWRKEIPLAALSMVFWFTSAGLWLFTTTTPTTSLVFWGIGIIMCVYVIVDSVLTLKGGGNADEEYEQAGLDVDEM
jgi:hypothetical protein